MSGNAGVIANDTRFTAGAITAALFLESFVEDTVPWAHFDIMAWNASAQPGKPEGGEAMAMRAAFEVIARHYAK